MKFTILTLVCILVSCGKQERRIENAHTYAGNEQIIWEQSKFPIKLYFNYDEYYLDADLKAAAEAAVDAWNVAMGFQAIEVNYRDSNYANAYTLIRDYLEDSEQIVFTPSIWPDQESENSLAITAFTYSSQKKLIHADILFNSTYDIGVNPEGGSFDIQSVLVHEIGHFLGVKHTSFEEDSTSVMNPSIAAGEVKRTLSALDVMNVRNLYQISEND